MTPSAETSAAFLTILRAATACFVLLVPTREAAATTAVEAALETAIHASLPWPEAEVDVDDLRVTGSLPHGELTWDVPPLRSIGSRARIRVFGDDGDEAWVSALVSIRVPVWVVDVPVLRGERVAPLVSVGLREARSLPTDVRFATEPLRDEIARATLAPGDVVRTTTVETPLVIERQQLVRLTVRRGAVTVETRGVALESGRRGDIVRVRPVTSETVLSGVVRDSGWLEVP